MLPLNITLRLILVFIALSSAVWARAWTDTKGIVVHATLVGVDAKSVVLRLAAGRELHVPLVKLCDDDQAYVAHCVANKGTANRIFVHVIQALQNGALCRTYRIVTQNVPTPVARQIDTFKSAGGGITYDTVNVPTSTPATIDDVAFVRGLTEVTDDDDFAIIVWTDGSYSYDSVGGAARKVPAYTIDPPAGIAPEASEFGQ